MIAPLMTETLEMLPQYRGSFGPSVDLCVSEPSDDLQKRQLLMTPSMAICRLSAWKSQSSGVLSGVPGTSLCFLSPPWLPYFTISLLGKHRGSPKCNLVQLWLRLRGTRQLK